MSKYVFNNRGIDIDKAIYYFKHNQKNIDLIPLINSDMNNLSVRMYNTNSTITAANNALQTNYNNAVTQLENRELDSDETLNFIYPIGSIYSSINDQNPNDLFPNSAWEELDIIVSDNDFMNAYYGTNDIEIITAEDGSKWHKIYFHDSNSGKTIFSTYHQALRSRDADKFSNLWLLLENTEPFLNDNNEYEFILQYYDISTGYNRWTQTSNPFHGTQNVIKNYSPIHVDWTTNFGGLARQNANITTNTSCLLSGQPTTSWFYAIAPYAVYNGGVPGPYIGNTATVVTSRTYLWIRVPKLENNNNLISQKLNIKYYKRIS